MRFLVALFALCACAVDTSTQATAIELIGPEISGPELTDVETATTAEPTATVEDGAYDWLPDSEAFTTSARSTACSARALLASMDASVAVDGAGCTSFVSTAPKSITLRKLLWRFLKNRWSKLIKSSDEALAKAANKMLTSPGLKKEAGDALAAAMKANPESATKGFKAFMGWVKNHGTRKIALGVIGIAIVSGALPYVFNELMDALKFHLFGIESQAQKVEKLEKQVDDLKKRLEEQQKKCAEVVDGDELFVATCTMEEDLLFNELLLYVMALEQEIAAYEAMEAEVDAELDAIEDALAGFGLAEIEPDPAL